MTNIQEVQARLPIAPHVLPHARSPLRDRRFRWLWAAAVVSYTGTWLQHTAAGWLMTSFTSSPAIVALVPAASSLPVLLAILPAGAVADVCDRRRVLLVTQSWMAVMAAVLGGLTLVHAVTPWTLLLLTFLLGLGAAINDPAWQAITPEIVAPEQLAPAVALNSSGYNLARAVGPALGGAIMALAGPGVAFGLNALSFAGLLVYLYRWDRGTAQVSAPPGRFWAALMEGVRYLHGSPAIRALLMRTGLFSFFASALWALLPSIARPYGSLGFGCLLAVFGLGTFAGATVLGAVRRRLPVDLMVVMASVIFAASLVALACTARFAWACLGLYAAGIGWIVMLTSLNVAAHAQSPAWIRARALSGYVLVLQGGMAAGSAVWGMVASSYGLGTGLTLAGMGLLGGLLTMRQYRLGGGNG
jgi:predicted MFS family arabinose efflux permease